MMLIKKIFLHITIIMIIISIWSVNVFADRPNNKIEVYKIGGNYITLKWNRYDSGGVPMDKYVIKYNVHGSAAFTTIDIDPSLTGSDYNNVNQEFSKKIIGLVPGTIYDFELKAYMTNGTNSNAYYDSIKVLTKIILDKSITNINNPYGDDDVGHLDFSFIAPNEYSVGTSSIVSVDKTDITGYSIIVDSSEAEVYSAGQPYKLLYDVGNDVYKVQRVTGGGDITMEYPVNNEFEFPIEDYSTLDTRDLISFSLYKNTQPAVDDFNLASTYYAIIKPIFKIGSGYEDVIVDATALYDAVESITTILPLKITQTSSDLIEIEFPQVGTGSMSYDILRGRAADSIAKIHTEYDDGSRTKIQYYNKLDNPEEGDVYYYKVMVSGQTYGVRSKIEPITISLNPNNAPVVNNVQIEKVIADTTKPTKYADIIVSWDKPDSEDKNNLMYRFYINTDLTNQVYTNDVIHDINGFIVKDANNKIKLNTKKDVINGDDILYNNCPVVFERIAEINPKLWNAIPYIGNDPIENFLVNGDNYYTITRSGKQVVRIMYRIKGEDFLSNTDVPILNNTNSSEDGNPHVIYYSPFDGELPTDYKTGIKLNTGYYLKMDTYNKLSEQKSDYSLSTNFTTPTGIVEVIPVPTSFMVSDNGIEKTKIVLEWDNDPTVTYEVFVSDNGGYNDSDFQYLYNPTIVTSGGKKYLTIDTNYTIVTDYNDQANTQVTKLVLSNKVYLFRIRARFDTLDANSNPIIIYSKLSEIVPVTTNRIDLSDPDMTAPPAPLDFTLTNITSKVADFTWTKVDNYSRYIIAKTSEPLGLFDAPPADSVTIPYDSNITIYTYSDATLSANTLYYFSIRAETINQLNQVLPSPWISIPVTTTLVEMPTEVSLVSRSADGHSITISWKGKASLNYETVKKDNSMTSYIISEGVTGNPMDITTKTFQLTLSGLKSNTQYSIKVHAKDPTTGMFSKFTDPIQIRTNFNQADYNLEQENKDKISYIDELTNKLLGDSIERVGYDNSRMELWIKQQIASRDVDSSTYSNFVILLNDNNLTKSKIAYLPFDLINSANKKKINIQLKTESGIFYFKPWLLNVDELNIFSQNTTVKSTCIKIQIDELSNAEAGNAFSNLENAASKAYTISAKIVGYNKTDVEFNKAIADAINNSMTVEKNYVSGRTNDQIRESINNKIKYDIKRIIDYAYVTDAAFVTKNKNLLINHAFNLDSTGKTKKYIVQIMNNNSISQPDGKIINVGEIEFEAPIPSKFIIIGEKGPSDIRGNQSEQYINILISNYNFSNEIKQNRFRPNDIATRANTINFVIDILNPYDKDYEGLDNVQKAQKLGVVDSNFPIWQLSGAITREELAYIISKVYEVKTGISPDDYTVSRNIYIQDEDGISENYKASVYQVLDKSIMSLYSQNLFYPEKQITRAEVMTALAKLIQKIDEVK